MLSDRFNTQRVMIWQCKCFIRKGVKALLQQNNSRSHSHIHSSARHSRSVWFFGTDSGNFVQFRGASFPPTPNINFSSRRILRLSIIKCYILINILKIKCDFLPCSCRDESLMFVLKEAETVGEPAVSSQTQTTKFNFNFVPGLLGSL